VNDRDVRIVMEALFDIRAGVYTIIDMLRGEDDDGEAAEEEDS
jgi:hypothetical protein